MKIKETIYLFKKESLWHKSHWFMCIRKNLCFHSAVTESCPMKVECFCVARLTGITLWRKQIHPHYMAIFLSFALNMCTMTRHNSTFAPAVSLRQMARRRVRPKRLRKPLSSVQSLWEHLICQHHYESLISSTAPVFGSPGVRCVDPPSLSIPLTNFHPQKLRRGLGIPIHPGWSTQQQLEEKAAVMRERKKGVCTHVPFVLLTTSPLVFLGHVHTIES